MKKVFVVLIALAVVSIAEAQKLGASKVPATVSTAFKKQNADVKSVTWEMENGNYEANYKNNGVAYSQVFDKNGNLLESEMDIKVSELPAEVPGYVKTHYKTSIREASKITKPNGQVEFEATLKHMDVIFDANGKYVREEKEEKDVKEKKQ